MKRLLLFSFFISFYVVTLRAQYTSLPNFQTPLGNIHITYPQNWTVVTRNYGAYSFKASLPHKQAIVNMSFIALPRPVNINNLKELVVVNKGKIAQMLDNETFISSVGLKWGAMDVQELVYKGKVNDRWFQWRQIIFLDRYYTYALTFTADATLFSQYVSLSDVFFNNFILKK